MLAFSRRQPLDPKPLDVNRFITNIVEFIQRTLGEGIKVEAVGAAGLWPVDVDHAQLETAIVNLAINARDAMPGGGKLTIEALTPFLDSDYCRNNHEVTPGQYVLLCVSDTGYGMSEEVASRTFEPFFTLQRYRTRYWPGAEPGLWFRQAIEGPYQNLQRAGRGHDG